MSSAKIMAFLGLNKTGFDSGMKDAKKQTDALADAMGGGKFAKSLGKGAWAAAIVMALKTATFAVKQWADEVEADTTGAFSAFEKAGAKSINNVAKMYSGWWQSVKGMAVGTIGKMFGGVESWTSGDDVAATEAEENRKAAQRDRIRLMDAEAAGSAELLKYKQDELRKINEQLKSEAHNLDLMEQQRKIKREVASLQDKIASEAAKEADARNKIAEAEAKGMAERGSKDAMASMDYAESRAQYAAGTASERRAARQAIKDEQRTQERFLKIYESAKRVEDRNARQGNARMFGMSDRQKAAIEAMDASVQAQEIAASTAGSYEQLKIMNDRLLGLLKMK